MENDATYVNRKADGTDFLGRFREIISDPLNLLIRRHPLAGLTQENYVYLHNGNKVPLSGPQAYYGDFSNILVINRGVHEPLEEFVFQELIKALPENPSMLELGAYWGHYSMWLKKMRPKSLVYLVEPDKSNLQSGKHNFIVNGLEGEFINSFVGKNKFEIDSFLRRKNLSKLHILHCDIQGCEAEMLDGSGVSLKQKKIDYLFISTHSQELHKHTIETLSAYDYRIEATSDYEFESTSYDGFVFASSPLIDNLFVDFKPFHRKQIATNEPREIIARINTILQITR